MKSPNAPAHGNDGKVTSFVSPSDKKVWWYMRSFEWAILINCPEY